jgi:hypothetical protein
MPRYFFHLVAPDGRSEDEIGSEFPGVEAAYLAAYQAALEIGIEMLRERHDPAQHHFEIADADGQALMDLPFAEAMQPSRGPMPHAEVHARLAQQRERTSKVLDEIKDAFARTRSLLKETRALLTRAQGG